MSPGLWLLTVAVSMTTAASLPQLNGTRPEWVDYFGTPATDWNNRFIELSNGDLIAAGYGNRDDRAALSDWSLLLRRYRGDGSLVWDRRLERPGLDAAWVVRELEDQRIAAAGFSDSGGSGGQDMYLAVFSPGGGLEWERWYGGAKDDRATDLLVGPNGEFILVGQTESEGAGERDVFVVKADPIGKELWRRTYGTPQTDRGFFSALAPDGNLVVAGVTGVPGNYDYLLMKIGADGHLIWRRVVAGEGSDANHGIAVLPDGTIVYVGYGPSWGGRGNDVSVLRFASTGELLSHQLIGGFGDDRVQLAAAAPSGAVWLTGYTKSFSEDWRMLVAKVAPGGQLEPWFGAIGGPADMNGSSVSVADNGDLLLGGYARQISGGAPDALAVRVNPRRIVQHTENVTVRTVQMSCTGPEADQICR